MQTSFRKTRCSQGHRKSRWFTFASISIGFFFISFFSSCTHTRKKTGDILSHSDKTKIWKNFCWNSEGKGRLETGKNRYVFDYEALHSGQEKNLKMALSSPLGGEELIELDYQDIGKNEIQIRGEFYQRIISEMESPQQAYFIRNLLRQWARLLDTYERSEKPEDEFTEKIRWANESDNSVIITLPVTKKHEFRLAGKNLDKYFSRIELSYRSVAKNSSGPTIAQIPKMRVILFSQKCFR